MVRIGLVFSGGGGKGAYQIGVWKALDELGITRYVRGISATSIGAINSMLFLSKDLNSAIEFWENIRRSDVAPLRRSDFINIIRRGSLSCKESLKELLDKNINFSLLNNDDIEVIIGCTKVIWGYPQKKFFRINYKERSYAMNVILASCTIPFMFTPHKIVEEKNSFFLDGGIRSRTPVEGLNYDNYDKIIVIHSDKLGKINLIKYSKKKYINIYPSIFQGGIYQGTYGFTYNLTRRRIKAGYMDTMKVLKPIIEKEIDDFV